MHNLKVCMGTRKGQNVEKPEQKEELLSTLMKKSNLAMPLVLHQAVAIMPDSHHMVLFPLLCGPRKSPHSALVSC